jgi:ketosteroid isomerase-like protein
MRRLVSLTLLAILLLIVPGGFAQAQSTKSGAPDKALMQQVLDAWSTMDPKTAVVYYSTSPDNVYFDIAPLKYNGWSEYEKGVMQVFAEYSSLKLTVNDDVRVHHNGKLVWATATFHLDGTHKDGSKDNTDGRWTAVWEKSGGKWLIVHEHVSLPAAPPAATQAGGGTKQ